MRIYNEWDNDDRDPIIARHVWYSRSRHDKEWPSLRMQVPGECCKTGLFKVRYYSNRMLLFCKNNHVGFVFYLVHPDHVAILDFMEWIE